MSSKSWRWAIQAIFVFGISFVNADGEPVRLFYRDASVEDVMLFYKDVTGLEPVIASNVKVKVNVQAFVESREAAIRYIEKTLRMEYSLFVTPINTEKIVSVTYNDKLTALKSR